MSLAAITTIVVVVVDIDAQAARDSTVQPMTEFDGITWEVCRLLDR